MPVDELFDLNTTVSTYRVISWCFD